MEILFRESGGHLSEIIVREIVAGFYCAGQETAAKRRVGYDCDVEFTTGLEEGDAGGFDVQGPGRVFYLHCGDWLLETEWNRGGVIGNLGGRLTYLDGLCKLF